MLQARKPLRFCLCFLGALLIVASLACNFSGSLEPLADGKASAQAGTRQTTPSSTHVYSNAGSDPNLTSLDVYLESGESTVSTSENIGEEKPIVVYVHGGSFQGGDKRNLDSKPQFFNDRGFHFVSVNYRLASPSHNKATFPVFVEDVAQAVAWVHENAASFGGDPNQIYLMGHSAGAYIVNILGTDEQFLENAGLSLDDIQGIISLDAGFFDLVKEYNQGGSQGRLIENAFGSEPSVLEAASPINQISPNENIPPFFLTYTNQRKQEKTNHFADLLRQAGAFVVTESSIGRSHSDVNREFGKPGDSLANAVLVFIEEVSQRQSGRMSSTDYAQTNSVEGSSIFQLAYTHDKPAGQATALLDTFGDGTLDLAIASKGRVHLVRNSGGMSFSHHSTLKTDNANGWGMHDFNADGFMDLFVAQEERGSKDSLFNEGNGSFLAKDLGNETKGNARSTIFADFDGDGNIDSYHSASSFQDNHSGSELHAGKADGTFGPDIIENILNPPIPNFWYAMADPPSRGREKWANKMMKGAVTRDFDGDGKPDIVTGAYSDRGFQEGGRGGYGWQWVDRQDRGLFVLQNRSTPGNIQFSEIAKSAAGNDAHGNTSKDWNVYSVIPIDYDRDGDFDLFVGATLRPTTNRQSEDTDAVRFYENVSTPGTIRFTERTSEVGLSYINDLPPNERSERNFASGQAIDYDNDGWTDLFLVNRKDPAKTRYPFVHLYRNSGDGKFQEVSYTQHGIGNGSGGRDLVGGDLDNDGLVDIVLSDGAVGGYEGANTTRVYHNQIRNSNHWIKVDLFDAANGSSAIGTKVKVYQAGTTNLIGYDEVRTDFCYRSKRSPILHFGLGSLNGVDVEAITRFSKKYTFTNLAVDQAHRLSLSAL
ncbi:MAG TPA: FG-GAP-like repeat-containing protein [Leptolyngbyaceae cyanobacterium]